MGGVGGGKVLVWHTISKTWSGAMAAAMYKDVVAPALLAHYPHKKTFTILEDNDPTGNMSKAGIKEKAAQRLHVLTIPKRQGCGSVRTMGMIILIRRQSILGKGAGSLSEGEDGRNHNKLWPGFFIIRVSSWTVSPFCTG